MTKHGLELIRYRFTLEAQDNIVLPAYKGSTFHGGFGHALKNISPIWYRYFFEPKSKDPSWPKPYVILPPLDKLERYPKGYQFQLDLTLFGEATQHYAIAQAAIDYLGTHMGLGYEQGKYRVLDIQQSQPETQNQITPQQDIKIHLSTRLRLKANNKLQRHPPTFSLFLNRLCGRIKTLETAYAGTNHNYRELIQEAEKIKLGKSNAQWDDWDRFSGIKKTWMKFGGLTGELNYQGDLTPFMDVLKLGEWLHVGNKTSFGLGKYELII